MSNFTQNEIEYLQNTLLGRLATAGRDGTPHVAPVGFSYNAALDTIDIGGWNMTESKKFRDVARTGRAAFVADDLASTDPWRPRGIEVRGGAEAIEVQRPTIRLYPERIVAWGVDTGEFQRDAFQRNARSVASKSPSEEKESEMNEALARVEREVLSWDGVWKQRDEDGPGGIGVTGYRLGNKQIGHVHDDGHADLRFHREIRDELIRSGKAVPHPAFPESRTTASYVLHGPADVHGAIDLFRKSYDRLKESAGDPNARREALEA